MKREVYNLTPDEGVLYVKDTVERWMKTAGLSFDDARRHLLVIDDTITANTVAVHCRRKDVPDILAYLSSLEHGVISKLACNKNKEIIYATMDFAKGKIPFGSYNDFHGKLIPTDKDLLKEKTE